MVLDLKYQMNEFLTNNESVNEMFQSVKKARFQKHRHTEIKPHEKSISQLRNEKAK